MLQSEREVRERNCMAKVMETQLNHYYNGFFFSFLVIVLGHIFCR